MRRMHIGLALALTLVGCSEEPRETLEKAGHVAEERMESAADEVDEHAETVVEAGEEALREVDEELERRRAERERNPPR
jgi:hypothetical protein